ncbi:thioredoxin domain-containing protein [Ectobacillus sp. JY-23]|uniref:thioredoxin family protein n=1 Tax=Ectobacillus sp. JY-23 TaxID=2933872 RepID=UPI001FF108F0|nr:thioredoxin domain-containing protein [Ectobacillus sp. JY-23]UOY91927.1 thioredoxin domain-containing protein [Ectobacillus sp. JY-23]
MAIVNATDESFSDSVQDGFVLVGFWAPWSRASHMTETVLKELDEQWGDRLRVVRVNVDRCQAVAYQLGITSIPTWVLFKEGNPFKHITDSQPKSFLDNILQKHI